MTISQDLIDYLDIDKTIEEAVKNSVLDAEDEEYSSWKDQNLHTLGIRCPECNRAYNIIHFECSEYIDVCSCQEAWKDQAYYCFECDVLWDESTGETINDFSSATGDTLFDPDDISNESYQTNPNIYDADFQAAVSSGTNTKPNILTSKSTSTANKGVITKNNSWNNWNYKTCSHKHDEVKLYDGTSIFCSSARAAETDKKPDFGLYADYIWSPTWRNEFIYWPDYGIPTDALMGLVQIYEAYYRATQDFMVEIGCIGGHGRTGTILAIMQVAAGQGAVKADEAIKFVRSKYCEHAIESSIQEWYIAYAASYWYGHDLPEKPSTTGKGYGTVACQMSEHFAMLLRGHKECQNRKDGQCQYWKQDLESFYKAEYGEQEKIAYKNALQRGGDYDYVYGGELMLDSDPEEYACDVYDHYVMMIQGHQDKCLRLGDKCKHWVGDLNEWTQYNTIMENKEWDKETVDKLLKIYPAVEELAK